MSESVDAETMGPVDVAVIVFEGNHFTGEVAPAIADLHDQGVVRVIDLAFVTKDLDGNTGVIEVEDADVAAAFERINGAPLDLLNDQDLDQAAADLEPGTSALVVVWENTWAARLAQAVRGANGTLVALQRIPRESVLLALSALDEE
jgi:uncharacterized membrane protein